MEKRLRQKYLQLIQDMNQKSQLRLPAIPQLVNCFAIMMSEEEVDFLLQIKDQQWTRAQLRQLSALNDASYEAFLRQILTNGYLWFHEGEAGEEVLELAPIFPGWIEVCLFQKEITPQRLQLLNQFCEIMKLEEKLNIPPVRHYWTWAKQKKLAAQSPTMTISVNQHSPKKKIVLNQSLQSDQQEIALSGEIYGLLQKYGYTHRIAVVNCFCRNIGRLKGRACQFNLPLEGCLAVGMFAKQMVEYGLGRYVDLDEAVAIVQECQHKGAVHTVFHYGLDTNQPEVCICNCCWDCCCLFGSYNAGGLSNISVRAHFIAVLTAPAQCNGCNLCNRFCPTNATGYDQQKGQLYLKEANCIGCGQCVTKCPRQVRQMQPLLRDLYIPTLSKQEIRVKDYMEGHNA